MANTPNTTLLSTIKNWFKTGSIPTQLQFWAVFDSFWHKSEKLPISSIDQLDSIIDAKADAEAFNNHTTDTNAHKKLFDKKVDKVDGMGLSSNDFTDEYKGIIDKCCPKSQPVTITLGAGLTANISFNGDSIKGNVSIEFTTIDDEVLATLDSVELCRIDFNTPLKGKPCAFISPSSPTYDYYVKSSADSILILTNSYDKTTKELFGNKAYPMTISFYYHIIE
jgi:hypothetical protein